MLKTKRFRRLLTVLLAVLMLSVSIPVAAFAAGDENANLKHTVTIQPTQAGSQISRLPAVTIEIDEKTPLLETLINTNVFGDATGYTVDKWTYDVEGTQNVISEDYVTADITVYAMYSAAPVNTYTITVQPVEEGATITRLPAVTFTVNEGDTLLDKLINTDALGDQAANYTINRWTYDMAGTQNVASGDIASADITVYAIYSAAKAVTHTVKIERNIGDPIVVNDVADGANLMDILNRNYKVGLNGDYDVNFTYGDGSAVIEQDIVTADTTVQANLTLMHTVTIKPVQAGSQISRLDPVTIRVSEGTALLETLINTDVFNGSKEYTIDKWTYDVAGTQNVASGDYVSADINVYAFYEKAEIVDHVVTIVRGDSNPDVTIKVEDGANLLTALNQEGVINNVLNGFEGYKVVGFTYKDNSEITNQDIVLADVTVRAQLELKNELTHTVTVKRSTGAADVSLSVKDGTNLLEALNAEENQAAIMDGCDGYKVTKYTYSDGSDIIGQDIVLADVTVVANMEAVPAEETPDQPTTPPTEDQPTTPPTEGGETTTPPTEGGDTTTDNNSVNNNTTTVTSNSNDKKDSGEEVVKSTAAPADNTAKVLPQTGVQASAPIAAFVVVLAAALAGAACYLFVVRKKLN